MARNLVNKTNVQPIDSDYPYARIKDDTGVGNGTPVNELVYGDFHQFFAKIFSLSGLTYNGLPDNAYSGFQFVEAAEKLWKRFIGVTTLTAGRLLTKTDLGNLIVFNTAALFETFTLPALSVLNDGDSFTFYNKSNLDTVIIRDAVPTTVDGGSGITLLKSGDFVELILDKPNSNWVIANVKITPIEVLPIYVYSQISATLTGTAHILVYQTEISDTSGLYDSTTGRFTPNKAGLYEITWSAVLSSLGGYTVQMLMGSHVKKNGVQVGFMTDRNDVLTTTTWITTGGTVLVEANGTTDYFEIELYNGSSLQKTIYGNFFAKKVAP